MDFCRYQVKEEVASMSVELAVVPDTQSKCKDDNPYEEYMWMGEEEYEFEQDVSFNSNY